MWSGYLGAAALWYACVNWVPLESFRRLPDPLAVATEWLSPHPTFGISIFTEAYYKHILYSTWRATAARSEEHTSELQSQSNLVCRLLLEKKKLFGRIRPRRDQHNNFI